MAETIARTRVCNVPATAMHCMPSSLLPLQNSTACLNLLQFPCLRHGTGHRPTCRSRGSAKIWSHETLNVADWLRGITRDGTKVNKLKVNVTRSYSLGTKCVITAKRIVTQSLSSVDILRAWNARCRGVDVRLQWRIYPFAPVGSWYISESAHGGLRLHECNAGAGILPHIRWGAYSTLE